MLCSMGSGDFKHKLKNPYFVFGRNAKMFHKRKMKGNGTKMKGKRNDMKGNETKMQGNETRKSRQNDQVQDDGEIIGQM